MPPCGFETDDIDPILLFVRIIYGKISRLAAERQITPEQALEMELESLKKRLLRLHLNEAGDLVARET